MCSQFSQLCAHQHVSESATQRAWVQCACVVELVSMWETLPDAMVEGQAEEVSACERAECAIDDDAELEDQGEDEDVEVGRGEDDEDEGGEEDEEDPAGGEARRAAMNVVLLKSKRFSTYASRGVNG